jgi:hypothetical protein
MQLGIGKLAGTVDGDKQVQFTFFCANLSHVDVEVTNRI